MLSDRLIAVRFHFDDRVKHHEAGHLTSAKTCTPMLCCHAANHVTARNYYLARRRTSSETVTLSLLTPEVSFRPNFQPADSTALRSRTTCNATTCTSCRVVERPNSVREGFERLTKELTASAPSAMKIKAVTPRTQQHPHCRCRNVSVAEVLFLSKTYELTDGDVSFRPEGLGAPRR